VKKLIVNADDFGLSNEINQGIIKAHEHGIVTSTSLVATGDAFEEAVSLIHQHSGLDVGVHLTLVQEKSVLPLRHIPTLVDERGYFRKSAFHFAWDYLKNRITVDDVRRELQAQIQKIREAGVSVSHLDSHQHVHVLPRIRRIILELACEFEIKMIRAPFENMRASYLLYLNKWPRLFQQVIFNALFGQRDSFRGCTTDHFFGFFESGHLSKKRIEGILAHLPTGLSEIMCHPGLNGERTLQKYGHWGYRWNDELRALTDLSIRDQLSSQRIVLTSFKSL
jgi:hopanoid biosynthesis associated protein HpnK